MTQVTEKQIEQAKEIVGLLQTKCCTNGYCGVEIDYPFDNLERYTSDYTIVHCLFENILDEIVSIGEHLKYSDSDEDYYGLTRLEARSHLKSLKRFIKNNARKYLTGNDIPYYMSKAEQKD